MLDFDESFDRRAGLGQKRSGSMNNVRIGRCIHVGLCVPVIAGLLAALVAFSPDFAEAASPSRWVKDFWPTAKAAGVSRKTYQAALGKFIPDPEVIEKASNQAEFRSQIWEYLDSTVTEKRIVEGRALLATHKRLLDRIESRYGVDRHVVVAIWGMESSYGAILNNPNVVRGTIRSLATLAYQGGSRAKYGRQQLIAALKIIDRGDISVSGMTGSWAGAMGHTQFIPTTYVAYAVDFDGDGRRNIWTSLDDALASTASYLDKMGWQSGETWGYEVALPKGFNTRSAQKKARSLRNWQKAGVRRPGGKGFPRPGDTASLYAPAGTQGPAFLVLKNFSVIKRYNNANSYALAVGHLADRLHGYDALQGKWPWAEEPLTDGEKANLQELLTARGYYSGEIDGNIGSGSRAAIQAYQDAIGLSDDAGLQKILELLKAGR
jgi:membrane-bound lytic murein transglycosylase B